MKGRTQKYYDENPAAKKVKAKQQAAFNKRPGESERRSELNKYNRDHGTYGNGDKKDASHIGGKIAGFESERQNRRRKKGDPAFKGDPAYKAKMKKRKRGGKRKKSN